MKTKVSKVTVKSEDSPAETFASIREANKYIEANPEVRFEFRVFWEDNTSQLGRLKGKGIDTWLQAWAAWMLAPEAELSGDQLKIRGAQSPGLFAHAAKLQAELSTE